MRTENDFNQNLRDKAIEHLFTPRIARDFKQLPIEVEKPISVDNTFIFGATKTGKTLHAAKLLLSAMKNDWINGKGAFSHYKFVSFPDMLAEIKETYSNPKKSEEAVILQYLHVPFLLIDDFITTRPTPWVMDILYRIINHRHEYLLPTIITSNYKLEELEDILEDQRITSRIDRSYDIYEKTAY